MFRRIYNIFIFAFLFNLMSPVYSEELRIEGDVSLLDVFEAGFRPRNVSGLEKSICQTENAEISLVFASGDKVEFFAERISFTVNRADIVVQLRASSPPINTFEARQIIRPFLVGNPSKTNNFETYVTSVEADALKAYDGFGFSFDPGENVKATLGLVAGNTSTDSPLRFVCTIQWTVENSRADRRDEVISPPNGFEDHSMEPASPTLRTTRDAENNSIRDDKPRGASEQEEVVLQREEEPRFWATWKLALIVIAVLGILLLLIRAISRSRAS